MAPRRTMSQASGVGLHFQHKKVLCNAQGVQRWLDCFMQNLRPSHWKRSRALWYVSKVSDIGYLVEQYASHNFLWLTLTPIPIVIMSPNWSGIWGMTCYLCYLIQSLQQLYGVLIMIITILEMRKWAQRGEEHSPNHRQRIIRPRQWEALKIWQLMSREYLTVVTQTWEGWSRVGRFHPLRLRTTRTGGF